MRHLLNWIKKNPLEFWILVFVLFVAAICRLYKIDQYMTFLGDEGRDVIIVRRIFTELHPPLIGPGTSVGQMYLGPLYYYMMAPVLFLAGFSPVGPAVQIAILGIITVGFVWWVGREWFGKYAALVGAAFYAISPTVINFSRSSWNPNIMPLFALLSIYSIWKVWKGEKFNWLVVLGISFAFVMQSHYLGLFLIPTLALFWTLTLKDLRTSKNRTLKIREFLKKSVYGILIFLVLMSPLLIFDFRHNFQNFKAFENLFAIRDGVASFGLGRAISNIPPMFNQVITALVGAKNGQAGVSVSIVIAILAVLNISKYGFKRPYLILFSWLGFGLLGFAFYKLPIYDHYFGFLFTVPFLLLGGLTSNLVSFTKVRKLIFVILPLSLLVLLVINLLDNPLRYNPNRQLQRSQNVARKILSEAGGKPFDLAVLAERNYEDGYRYFLELWGGEVLHADKWNPATIADQLFVVCEMEEKKCDPTHSPKAEVANFGMSKIDAQWETGGVIIYKLVHAK